MKNKKGFTLIELLAVIVILAIIALIAVPIILNVIEKSKQSSAVDSAYGYIHAIEEGIATKEVKDGTIVADDEYENLREFETNNEIGIKGTKPSSGFIRLQKRRVVYAELVIDGYSIICDKKTCESKGKTELITITYDLDGGNLNKSSERVGKGTNVTLPTPTKDTYGFDGWYLGNEKVNNETVFNESVTLVAHWIKNRYTITFDAGDGESSLSSTSVEHGGKLENLPTATAPTGYTFNGWYTESTGGVEVLPTKTYTESTTLYAHYTKNIYIVNIVVTNGSSVSNVNISYGESNTLTLTPENGMHLLSGNCTSGYTLTNMNTNTSFKDAQTVTIKNSNTLDGGTCTFIFKYSDNSGASYPKLYQGLIPVKYDSSGNTIIANTNEKWYDYNAHEWANAVLVTETARSKEVGSTLSSGEILQYYVWIPRYKYQLWNVNSTSNEQMINITFEDKTVAKSNGSTNTTWLTHPSFTFGSTELDGFWVGKFETLGTNTDLKILPNLRESSDKYNLTIQFDMIRAMDITYSSKFGLNSNEIDTHMIKNTEWGAVAYLSSSIYGRYLSSSTCTSGGCEVWTNPYFSSWSIKTGCAGTSVNYTCSDSHSCTTCNAWHTANGVHASTTDNMYGVYDMSGGTHEHVMANASSSLTSYVYNPSTYGPATQPLDRYMDKYVNGNSDNDTNYYNFSIGKLGDSTKEVVKDSSTTYGSWYGDRSVMLSKDVPWLSRGGSLGGGSGNGIFGFVRASGIADSSVGTRNVLSAQDGNYNGNGYQ